MTGALGHVRTRASRSRRRRLARHDQHAGSSRPAGRVLSRSRPRDPRLSEGASTRRRPGADAGCTRPGARTSCRSSTNATRDAPRRGAGDRQGQARRRGQSWRAQGQQRRGPGLFLQEHGVPATVAADRISGIFGRLDRASLQADPYALTETRDRFKNRRRPGAGTRDAARAASRAPGRWADLRADAGRGTTGGDRESSPGAELIERARRCSAATPTTVSKQPSRAGACRRREPRADPRDRRRRPRPRARARAV